MQTTLLRIPNGKTELFSAYKILPGLIDFILESAFSNINRFGRTKLTFKHLNSSSVSLITFEESIPVPIDEKD